MDCDSAGETSNSARFASAAITQPFNMKGTYHEQETHPTLIAYSIRERGKGQKDIWTRIGAAWPHSSGIGLQHSARGASSSA